MKSNRKFTPDSNSKQVRKEEDYEDYGYDVKNAKRFKSRAKRSAKFRNYDEFD